MFFFYRISSRSQVGPSQNETNKPRPDYFDKKKIFINFIKTFGTDNLYVIADSCDDDFLTFIKNTLETYSVNKIINLAVTNFGNGCDTFKYSVQLAFNLYEKKTIHSNDILYFVEDDYIHRNDSENVLKGGLDIFHYLTLYDHPDKYVNANTINKKGVVGNPYISNSSELTRVYLGEKCHYKLTNSTTMTFATKTKTILEDWKFMLPYLKTSFPFDFNMFLELNKQNRSLGCTIPSYSTHCELTYLAPLIDWKSELILPQ